MKFEYFEVLLIFLLASNSCKKAPAVSTWSVNDIQYSAKATATIGKAVSILSNENTSNGFKLVVFIPYLPTNGQWLIIGDNYSQDPNVVSLYFYANGKTYYISNFGKYYLDASEADGKAVYTLDGAWYVNYLNKDDSVFIKAKLYETTL